MLRALLQASRPLAHANIAPPIALGQALAYASEGTFSLDRAIVAHVFGVLAHLVIVFANDYADREADARNTSPTLFSGGSRVLPEGKLAPRTLLGLAIGAALALVSLGVLTRETSPPLLPLALTTLALVHAYSYPPLRLSYRGGGELLQGLGVGVVLPLVGALAQAPSMDLAFAAMLLPSLTLATAGNVLTALPDADADRASDKRTWAVRRGEHARLDLCALVALSLALGAALLHDASTAARLTALALPAVPLAWAWRRRRDPRLLAFVVAVGASASLAQLAWIGALITSR